MIKLDLNIILEVIIPLFIISIGIYIFSNKMKKKIKNIQATIGTYTDYTDKLVNITYISELKELNINDLDKNICTIILKNDLSKTDKVKLLASLCKDLNIEIEHFHINDSVFLSCLRINCFSALIFEDKKITITSQEFKFLLVLHNKISDILKSEFSNEIQI